MNTSRRKLKMQDRYSPSILERLICCATYFSGGLIGVIWLIICFLMKINVSFFTQYHVSQSVVFWLIIYVFNLFLSIFIGFLIRIPFLGDLIANIIRFFQAPLYFGFSLIGGLLTILVLYMAILALLGLYSYVPFLSDLINTRRR